MTALTIAVVILSIIVIFLLFKVMGWSFCKANGGSGKQQNTASHKPGAAASGEVNAAIAMALYLHKNQMHDQEHHILTINQVSRTYSPWSSKIYGLTRFPRS